MQVVHVVVVRQDSFRGASRNDISATFIDSSFWGQKRLLKLLEAVDDLLVDVACPPHDLVSVESCIAGLFFLCATEAIE